MEITSELFTRDRASHWHNKITECEALAACQNLNSMPRPVCLGTLPRKGNYGLKYTPKIEINNVKQKATASMYRVPKISSSCSLFQSRALVVIN